MVIAVYALIFVAIAVSRTVRPDVLEFTQRASSLGLYPCRVVRIVVKDPEEFEQALREFRRKVQEQGLVREMRRRSHYVPPAEARKIKSLRARRRRTR